MSEELSLMEERLLGQFRRLSAAHGYPPDGGQLAKALGVSHQRVYQLLSSLAAKGAVTVQRTGKSQRPDWRTLKVVDVKEERPGNALR